LAARTAPKAGLRALLGSGAWWWAVGLNASGGLLHVVALAYGPLTVVQPLGALTLVAAVPLGARRAGRQVSREEWRGTAFTLVGLAAILLTAAGTGTEPNESLSLAEALGVGGVALTLVALLARPGARPGLPHAAASGIASGVASALTQTITVAAAGGSMPGGPGSGTDGLVLWQVMLVAVLVAGFAVGGLLLSQTAYHGGLGAPLAVLTLANPVGAAVIGLTLLDERLQGGGLGIAAALVGAVVAARGVVLLTDTPAARLLMDTPKAPEQERESEPESEPTSGPAALTASGEQTASGERIAPVMPAMPAPDGALTRSVEPVATFLAVPPPMMFFPGGFPRPHGPVDGKTPGPEPRARRRRRRCRAEP
ncbi:MULTISPECIES: hypothetical protein, partial [unclassified Streptomyces]|uniref:hypothetical protein n=1 Tax=unclassified Streptomyces TaxID=2593676 RepID=UPI00081D3D78